MNFNATLIFQSVAFLIFVLITWRFVWPPILKAMNDRQARIADGLAAAEKGNRALQDATAQSEEALRAARAQAQDIIGAAGKQASQLLDQAKQQAEVEKGRIVASGRAEAEREIAQAKDALRKQVGELAVAGASTILKREIDAKAHAELLDQLAAQV